jgi:hypothetical protein
VSRRCLGGGQGGPADVPLPQRSRGGEKGDGHEGRGDHSQERIQGQAGLTDDGIIIGHVYRYVNLSVRFRSCLYVRFPALFCVRIRVQFTAKGVPQVNF